MNPKKTPSWGPEGAGCSKPSEQRGAPVKINTYATRLAIKTVILHATRQAKLGAAEFRRAEIPFDAVSSEGYVGGVAGAMPVA